MARSVNVLIWVEGGQRYGLPVENIRKAERMVAITALRSPVPGLLGVINVAGQVVPVISLKPQLDAESPGRPRFTDQLVLGRSQYRTVALLAEQIEGVTEVNEESLLPRGDMIPMSAPWAALIKSPAGLVLMPELDELLHVPLEPVHQPGAEPGGEIDL